MKKWLHKLERVIDRIIPYTLVILLFLIIGEIFYHEEIMPYHTLIEIVDILIILIFATDLGFKYSRVRNLKKFFKKYWLDVIAIFPFFLVFRVFEELALVFAGINEFINPTQKILHEGLEVEKIGAKVTEVLSKEKLILQGIEKEGAKLIKEVEAIGKVSRTEKIARFIRPASRGVRFAKFESPEIRKDIKKEAKKVEREIIKGERFLAKEVIKGEKFIEREIEKGERKLPRFIRAFLFYEKPSGKHYLFEKKK